MQEVLRNLLLPPDSNVRRVGVCRWRKLHDGETKEQSVYCSLFLISLLLFPHLSHPFSFPSLPISLFCSLLHILFSPFLPFLHYSFSVLASIFSLLFPFLLFSLDKLPSLSPSLSFGIDDIWWSCLITVIYFLQQGANTVEEAATSLQVKVEKSLLQDASLHDLARKGETPERLSHYKYWVKL